MYRVVKASRRDDLVKEYNAFKERRDASKQKHDQEYENFRNAQDAVIGGLVSIIKRDLAKFDKLDAQVVGEVGYMGKLMIRVEVDERQKFEENSALSWRYEARLNRDGEVEKETGSWSGLKATTSAQLESLHQTVEALDYLNSLDWAGLLQNVDATLPKYEDFVTPEEQDPDANRNFRAEIKEAAVEDYVGTNTLLYGDRFSYAIVRETPKFYEVIKVSNYNIDDNNGAPTISEQNYKDYARYTQKVKKDEVLNEVVDENGNVTEVQII